MTALAYQNDTIARRNALVLALASGLAGANATVVFATGGLVGLSLAPQPALATVPLTSFVVGSALATFPAAMLARSVGRRNVFLLGNLSGVAAGLLAALAVQVSSFLLFCLATLLAGAYHAVVNSYRFAAADSATPGFRAKAISWVMLGGVMAAVIGPQLVIHTRELLPPYLFVGTFLAQAGVAALAMLVTNRFTDVGTAEVAAGPQRTLAAIIAQPRFIAACLCGTLAQTLMNMVMTAAPLAMAQCGFGVVESTLGIQWHVLAMFGPSFFTGALIVRFGKEKVVVAGLLLLAASGATHLAGITLANFWVGLVLLGLGWNLAFIGASAMVTDVHTPAERNKVQGFNDLVVFSTTALGSFLSGKLLALVGWGSINAGLLPLVLLGVVAVLVLGRAGQAARP